MHEDFVIIVTVTNPLLPKGEDKLNLEAAERVREILFDFVPIAIHLSDWNTRHLKEQLWYWKDENDSTTSVMHDEKSEDGEAGIATVENSTTYGRTQTIRYLDLLWFKDPVKYSVFSYAATLDRRSVLQWFALVSLVLRTTTLWLWFLIILMNLWFHKLRYPISYSVFEVLKA